MVKVGVGLSTPIQMKRGIRQGCSMSGQLYSLAIEPLLYLLRKTGLSIRERTRPETIKLSAYADDITVIIKTKQDIPALQNTLRIYERASSAKL